ncbi:MAG: ArsR/SmtB family transcription factor [Halobacteriaceae archaeon]
MADLLPGLSEVEDEDPDPRVLGLDSDDADEVLGALSAGTARSLLTAVHEDPATPSELAERADTSLQNAQYHIEKLEDADLIEVRGTRYSEKGREMNVYGPTDRPLVLFAGGDDEGRSIRDALRSFIGAVGGLAIGSLLVQVALRGVPSLGGGGGAGAGGAGGDTGPALQSTDAASNAASSLPPGLLFFLGGLLALSLVIGWRAVRD